MKVKIQESSYKLADGSNGKIAVLMYMGNEDPYLKLNEIVLEYTGNKPYHEFIDINMDNPGIRILISDINQMKQDDYNPSKHIW